MPTRRPKLTITITPAPRGGHVVTWRADGKIAGLVPIKDRARADVLKALLARGVPPMDATARAFRPRRRAKIGETNAISAKYGRLGAERRQANLSPERRREIAQQAALARWGTPKPATETQLKET